MGRFKNPFARNKKDVTVGQVAAKLVTDTAFLNGKWRLFAMHLETETEGITQVECLISKGEYVAAFWKLLDLYVSAKGNGALVVNVVDALKEHKLIRLKEQIEVLGNGRLVSEQYKPFPPRSPTPDTQQINRPLNPDEISIQLEQLTTDDNLLNPNNTIVVNNVPELGKDEDIANDLLYKHHKMSNLKILKAKRIGKSSSNPFASNKKTNAPRPLAISLTNQHGKKSVVLQSIIDTLNSSPFTQNIGACVSKYFKTNNPSITQGQQVHKFGNVLQPTAVQSQPVRLPHHFQKPPPPKTGSHNRWEGVGQSDYPLHNQTNFSNNQHPKRSRQTQEQFRGGNIENCYFQFQPAPIFNQSMEANQFPPTYISQGQQFTAYQSYHHQTPNYHTQYVLPNMPSQTPHSYLYVPNELGELPAEFSPQNCVFNYQNF